MHLTAMNKSSTPGPVAGTHIGDHGRQPQPVPLSEQHDAADVDSNQQPLPSCRVPGPRFNYCDTNTKTFLRCTGPSSTYLVEVILHISEFLNSD